MAWYRKTTPSSYPSTPTSNFTDTSKNWRQYKNMYRKTSDLETASLTAVPGRYTDSTRTWRRIRAIYRYTSSGTWQKVFGKFAGQPYPQIAAAIRYSDYDGVDVGSFAMMGPGSESIAQGSTATTFLWGKDGQDWQNIESLASRVRTFVYGSTPVPENSSLVTNDEGNFDGDKLRNTEAVISQYDGQYVWYRDRITLTNGSTGTSYSQTVKIIKQQPVINSLAFKTSNTVSAGSAKYITYSLANQWYRSVDQYTSILKWYILDTQFETPTEAKLYGSTYIYSTVLTETTTTLTGEDYFNIPETFNSASTVGKWLHVKIICKNSSSDTDVDYTVAPYNDVTDYIVAQISGAVPIGTNSTVTVTRVDTSYEVKVDSGNTGTWSNSPTSYRYQWYIQEQTVGSSYTWSPIAGATSSTYNAVLYKPSDTSTTNRIVPVVWASNASGESNSGYALTNSGGVSLTGTLGGITIANPTSSTSAMIKYKLPVITTFTVTAGTRRVSYVSNFSSDDPSATPSISYSGAATGSFTPSSSTSSVDYLNLSAGTYNFTLTVSNASTNALTGSVTATQNSIVVTGPATYDFNFNNTIYQGTNGYTSFDSSSNYGINPIVTTGRVLAIYPQDLVQGISSTATGTGYLLYWSNADEYVLQWTGFRLGFTSDATYQLRYQIRFYKDQAYADIKYILKGSNLTTSHSPGMYYDGGTLGSLYNGAISQGTTLRIYFDGSAPLAGIAFTEVPNSNFINAGGVTQGRNSPANADDSSTTLTAYTNQFVSPGISIASITAASTSLSVDVTPVIGSYSYYSYNLTTGSYTGTSVASGNNETSDPLSITGLTASTTYYLTLTPYNGMGQAGNAVQDSKATTAAIPSTPTGITITPDDEDSISLDWDDMTGAASYEIYYTTNILSIPASNTAATVTGITNSNYQLTSAAANTTYYFFIRARNTTGASAYSGQNSGKTAPAIPTGFAAAAVSGSSTSINLTWTNVTGVSTSNGYEIYRSISTTNPSFSATATITDSGTPYADTGLTASTDYYYWIRSTNGTTKSNWSSRVTAKTNSAAVVPSGGSVSINGLFLGNAYVGDTISATTSGWSGSPTSYAINLRTSTSTVNESSTSLVSNSPNTSASTAGYVVTSTDAVSPANNFKAFAYASNADGTSTVVSSATAIAKVNSGTVPGTPTNLVNGWTSGTNYPFSWTAPTSTGKDKDGTTNATITGYYIEVYEATSNTGTGATLKLISAPTSTTYTYTSSNSSLYAAFKIQAINSAGKISTISGYSAWK